MTREERQAKAAYLVDRARRRADARAVAALAKLLGSYHIGLCQEPGCEQTAIGSLCLEHDTTDGIL